MFFELYNGHACTRNMHSRYRVHEPLHSLKRAMKFGRAHSIEFEALRTFNAYDGAGIARQIIARRVAISIGAGDREFEQLQLIDRYHEAEACAIYTVARHCKWPS